MITVRGILTVVDWDDEGNVLALVLSSFNEEEYLIETDSLFSLALKEHVRNEVEITGNVTGEKKGRKVIDLKEIRVIREN